VASAGFGNGIAIAPQQSPSRGSVQSTGFGDAAPAATTEAKQRVAAPVSRTPVEILAKPNPAYTEEARRLKIEGDVKLRVVFQASGELQILGVTQGLGHGLDEAAVAAARRIKFRPAREGDRPVDQAAVITIEFKLAY
jgi:TonB family protein